MEQNPDKISAPLNSQDILSHLQWYVDSGVDETVDDHPLDQFIVSAETAKPPSQAPRTPAQNPSASPLNRPVAKASPLATTEQTVQQVIELAQACETLPALQKAIEAFSGCSLQKTATHTVFSDGTLKRKIMIVGEVPGVTDDRLGKPFVGENGALLDRMFKAIGLDRNNDIYLTNMLPWRPPGNRTPTPEEIAICRPFIRRHIMLAKPKILILLGGISAKNLLDRDEGIARLRGKWAEYDAAGEKIPTCSLYHPSYLIKHPKAKKDTWKDLLAIKARIEGLNL